MVAAIRDVYTGSNGKRERGEIIVEMTPGVPEATSHPSQVSGKDIL